VVKQAASIKKNGNSITFQISLPYTKIYYPEMKSGNKYLYYGAEYNEKNVLEASTALLELINDLENNNFDRDNIKKYQHKSKKMEVQTKLVFPSLNHLADKYYSTVKRKGIEPGSVKRYESIIIFLNECPQDVSNYKNIVVYIRNSGRGAYITKDTYNFLVKAFEWGVNEDILLKDFLEIEKLIKYEKNSWLNSKLQKSKRIKPKFHTTNNFIEDKQAYPEEVLEVVIKRAKEKYPLVKANRNRLSYIGSIIEFIARTGVRTGEAIALTWGDINFEKQEIMINKSYCSISRKLKSTKTGKSRIFPFRNYTKLIKFLEEIKPDNYNKNEIIFKSSTGEYMDRTYLSMIWSGCTRRGKDKIGLIKELINEGLVEYHIPLYNLRHSFITIQLLKTKDPMMVSKWTGHDPNTLIKHYAQLMGTESSPLD
jgi:integrase